MKIEVSYAIGHVLDWMVAKCLGVDFTCGDYEYSTSSDTIWARGGSTERHYSTDWSQGGPIIEREKIAILPNDGHRFSQWHAFCWTPSQCDLTFEDGQSHNQHGPTPLIAAMRCFAASRLGEGADVPEELL